MPNEFNTTHSYCGDWKHRAQSTIELVVGLILLIPVILFIIDISVIGFAVSINDAACRDAARAAAAGRPVAFKNATGATLTENALERAQAVVSRAQAQAGGYITSIQVLTPPTGPVLPTAQKKLILPDPTYGGQYQGTYIVSTQVQVKIPVSFGPIPSTYQFQSQQQFPITFIEPSVFTAG